MSLIDKTGRSKGFAFIITPEKLYQELLKLDSIHLFGRKTLIQEVILTRKKNPEQNRRPSSVVNNFPDYQDIFKQFRTVPGNKFYATAVSECEANPAYTFFKKTTKKENFITGDGHITRIKKYSLRKTFKGDKEHFKCFSAPITKQLDH